MTSPTPQITTPRRQPPPHDPRPSFAILPPLDPLQLAPVPHQHHNPSPAHLDLAPAPRSFPRPPTTTPTPRTPFDEVVDWHDRR